jgi:hypothetical protein
VGEVTAAGVHLHLGRLNPGRDKLLQQPHAVEHLQAAGVNGDRPRLGGRRGQLVDHPDGNLAPGKFTGGDQPHRPGARDDYGGVRTTHVGSLSAVTGLAPGRGGPVASNKRGRVRREAAADHLGDLSRRLAAD